MSYLSARKLSHNNISVLFVVSNQGQSVYKPLVEYKKSSQIFRKTTKTLNSQ